MLNQILYSGLLHSGFGIQKPWQMKTAQILQLTRSLTPRKLDNTAEMNIDIMSDIAVMPYPMSQSLGRTLFALQSSLKHQMIQEELGRPPMN